jgi:hypothetical protein
MRGVRDYDPIPPPVTAETLPSQSKRSLRKEPKRFPPSPTARCTWPANSHDQVGWHHLMYLLRSVSRATVSDWGGEWEN